MAVNQQRKTAMKRLMRDLDELQQEPVDSVSAAPLDSDMFEWHCNFQLDDTVYHVILFFPESYPFVSPSAEFVPQGFQFMGGATMPGKKGVKVCLSIFSDFATYHPEWATEKSAGWSPGYTVQTVLLNLLSFMAEMMSGETSWAVNVSKNNSGLAKKYTCTDCGHTHAKPFPELDVKPQAAKKTAKAKTEAVGVDIVDYISKVKFTANKPKSKEDLFGFGLIQSGPPTRPAFTSPCEYLTGSSFFGMKSEVGRVQSIMKDELAFFLPMYITRTHGEEISATFEETMKELAQVMPSCKRAGIDDMVIKTIPNLMSATVVEFSKGTQHTSDNHLQGYFALHRLFLWAIKTYPDLQEKIDTRLETFIGDQAMRKKNKCPHIGEWLMLLAGSTKYKWHEAADAYLSESWRRGVMWYVKDDAKLGMLDTDKKYRLETTLKATAVSRKLLAFQVLFLDIAMPPNMTRTEVLKRYDDNYGLPTEEMVLQMKQACEQIEKMETYSDWFKVLKLPVPSDDEIFKRLTDAVEYSINTDGYKWTFWKNQGGWAQVLKKYPKGTPGWTKTEGAGKAKEEKPASAGKGKGKGKGRGKSSKVKEQAAAIVPDDDDDDDDDLMGKGKGRGKSRGKRSASQNVGKGRAKKVKVVESESEEEMEVDPVPEPKGRGKGRGRGRGQVSRGRGRGKRGR